MQIKIERNSWDDYENPRGYVSDSSEKVLPLVPGPVEDCPIFNIIEIREKSVIVAAKEGYSFSMGTYSEWPKSYHSEGYQAPVELQLGGRGLSVSSSGSYNGHDWGSTITLYIIED